MHLSPPRAPGVSPLQGVQIGRLGAASLPDHVRWDVRCETQSFCVSWLTKGNRDQCGTEVAALGAVPGGTAREPQQVVGWGGGLFCFPSSHGKSFLSDGMGNKENDIGPVKQALKQQERLRWRDGTPDSTWKWNWIYFEMCGKTDKCLLLMTPPRAHQPGQAAPELVPTLDVSSGTLALPARCL